MSQPPSRQRPIWRTGDAEPRRASVTSITSLTNMPARRRSGVGPTRRASATQLPQQPRRRSLEAVMVGGGSTTRRAGRRASTTVVASTRRTLFQYAAASPENRRSSIRNLVVDSAALMNDLEDDDASIGDDSVHNFVLGPVAADLRGTLVIPPHEFSSDDASSSFLDPSTLELHPPPSIDEEAAMDPSSLELHPPPSIDEEAAMVSDEYVLHQQDYHRSMDDDESVASLMQAAAHLESEPKKSHSVGGSSIESLKYLYSMALLIFSIVVVMAAMFTKQTVATYEYGLHPALACVIFWCLIVWLAIMEGGQGCLVGLQPVDKSWYQDSHKIAFSATTLCSGGSQMERFIVGRQFLVVGVVFVINELASSSSGASGIAWLPLGVNDVFLLTGLAVILVTIMMGQLTAQVNAAHCMLDFVNNYFMLFTTYVSLAMEQSGLLHSVYLLQWIVSKCTKNKGDNDEDEETPAANNEPPMKRSAFSSALFWGRVVLSLLVLGFSFSVTLSALFQGKTTMWEGVPGYVSVILLLVLMIFAGLMEGMQIALFAVVNMSPYDLATKTNQRVEKLCQAAFKGQNLQAFLIGRQICVTSCMFVVARITSIDVADDEDTIFGVSRGLQRFFDTGLLGAVITTIVASLIWRVLASSYPVAFLSNPLIYYILRLCLLMEYSGVCSASWVLARYQKLLANYQPDEVHLEGAEPHTSEPVTRRDKDIDRVVTVVKYSYSIGLLIFSIILVMAAIFSNQTIATEQNGMSPGLACAIFWFLILWLATIEGGQGAMVGLYPIDSALYAKSHPRTEENTAIVHKGDNIDRYIVGRQFLVVLIIFVTYEMASTVFGASVLGLSDFVNELFLSTGLAVIFITIILGQLTAQVNAANCMLDFLNNQFMLFTTYVSLAIESSGLLHAVYLVQIFVARINGTPIETFEPPRTGLQNLFFWARVAISLAVFVLSFEVTVASLFSDSTAIWEGAPVWASVLIFIILMLVMGMMDGMQIALFSVVNMPDDELAKYPMAARSCQLAFRDQNLQAFLIGRQICVTVCMFVFARVTNARVDIDDPNSENLFGVSDSLQKFFNTGIPGAVMTTIVASLAWRMVASAFPLSFLSNPFVYLAIRLCLILEASGICSSAWVLGRFNKLLADFQPDEVYLDGARRHTKAPVTSRDKDIDVMITSIKFFYSMGLLIFSIIIVMAAIFSKQTKVAETVSPILAFVAIWGLILWLAMMEGGQGCLVGLQAVENDLYAVSHPISLKSTTLAHKGDNMERFIVGRQFLVVLVVFVINMCGGAVAGASVLGLSDIADEIFLASGLAMILMTITLGQLTAQINSAHCMLDFINNYFMLFITYTSLAMEKSGLLHAVYLVQIIFSKIAGQEIKSKEPERGPTARVMFWARVVVSLVVLGYSLAVTLRALFDGKTTMYEGVHESVSVAIFVILLCFVGLMEGMQIALFAVVNMPEEELAHHPVAAKTCELVFKGLNLQAFLIGRQICVTMCMFIVARITSVNVDIESDDSENIFGVSDRLQHFFNTGLLGAVITTIFGSLAWRIIASSFPIAFLSNPLVYLIIRLCLILEDSGICSAAWQLALTHKNIMAYQPDENYIGTPEERAAGKALKIENVETFELNAPLSDWE